MQTQLSWEKPENNQSKIDELLTKTDGEIGDLIILPEMFTTGFSMDTRLSVHSHKTLQWMKSIAKNNKTTLIGSFMVADGTHYYNRLHAVSESQMETYDKRHLFNNEKSFFNIGNERLIFKINDWRICPMICYDLRFPVWSRNRNDYDLLVYIANWPASRAMAWEILLKARAIENQCYVVGINILGSDGNGIQYQGKSMVIDPRGNILLDMKKRDAAEAISLSMDELIAFREKFPVLPDADHFNLSE